MDDRPGIEALESLRYYVHDLERSTRFYLNRLGFELTHESRRDGSHERTFRAGRCEIVCAMPIGEGDAERFLRHHPDGIGEIVFRVGSARHALAWLESRGATPVDDARVGRDGRSSVAITTPFGDCLFRFIDGEHEPVVPTRSCFDHVDHVTANFETLAPAALWLEHVLGFRDFWKVELSTGDDRDHGTGLRSRVMVDPESGVKFALNEPRRPNFHASQIDLFVDENHGPGIQHIALAVHDLVGSVAALRARGVEFLETPGSYYDALPDRLRDHGIVRLDESFDDLRRLGILVDGAGAGRYLLQIFLRDSATLYGEKGAGPFFFELIERKGDAGFGEGNFRALFESIERDQVGTRGAA